MSDIVSVALITALVTLAASLGAVFITNRAENKRLYTRMQHEKEEATRERLTRIQATYLEPVRDSLSEFNLHINRFTKQMNITSQGDYNNKNLEPIGKGSSELSKDISLLAVSSTKVTDAQLTMLLKTFFDLCSGFINDINAKLNECKQNQSLKPFKGGITNFETNKKDMARQIMLCNKRIEELLSGHDAN